MTSNQRGDTLRRTLKLVLPAALMLGVMLMGALVYFIPSPRLSDEWPLPSERTSFSEFSSVFNSTSLSESGFFLLGYQPVLSLGAGFDFPAGSTAYVYLLGYGNGTFVQLLVSKFPDAQTSLQFGARALARMREQLPQDKVRFLYTEEGGYLHYDAGNQTLSLWYGRSWFFEALISGSEAEKSLSSLKRLISNAPER